jgi:predicted TPR repeat methyltransferase
MDWEQAIREGAGHHKAGRLHDAERCYREVLRENPDQPDAMYLLGLLAHQAQRKDAALGYLARAAALRPNVAAWQHHLAEAWLATGELDQAIAAYRKAIAIEPSRAEVRVSLAVALSRNAKLDESVAQFEKAFSLGLNHPDAFLHYAKVLLGRGDRLRGDWDNASEACRKAVALRADSAEAWQTLGEAVGRLGKLDESVDAFRRAIALKGDYERPYHGLGVALAQQGKLEEAIGSFETALRLRPQYPEAHQGLAAIYHKMGKIDAAASHYVTAISQRPANVDVRFEYAALLENKGDIRAAIDQYQVILRFQPDLKDVRFHISALEEGRDAPPRAPVKYVVAYFDSFASNFDEHLTKALAYRGPELMLKAIREHGGVGEPAGTLDVLDLGCGTGLMGQGIRLIARRLVGVDVSAGMLQKARARGIYDELLHDDLVAGLAKMTAAGRTFDLIVSSDVFIYFGDLGPVFDLISKALRPGGVLAFLTESAEAGQTESHGPDSRLLPTRRYAHSLAYLRRLCERAGLEVTSAERVCARLEKDQPVEFWLVVGRKQSAG